MHCSKRGGPHKIDNMPVDVVMDNSTFELSRVSRGFLNLLCVVYRRGRPVLGWTTPWESDRRWPLRDKRQETTISSPATMPPVLPSVPSYFFRWPTMFARGSDKREK